MRRRALRAAPVFDHDLVAPARRGLGNPLALLARIHAEVHAPVGCLRIGREIALLPHELAHVVADVPGVRAAKGRGAAGSEVERDLEVVDANRSSRACGSVPVRPRDGSCRIAWTQGGFRS